MSAKSRVRGRAAVRLLWGMLPLCGPAISDGEAGNRLQQLLAGEARFHYYQQDYFTAITKLHRAREAADGQPVSAETQVLMARLQLAYGLNTQAAAALDAIAREDATAAADLAWFELARSFYRKGQPEAALNALSGIQGQVPAETDGELQLLHAHVLSALGRYSDAARVLSKQRGPAELAPYRNYNLGIAAWRAGDHSTAIDALQRVATLSAAGEELLALRDKSNLTLGYILLQREQLDQSRKQLEKVRLEGPFSNQALLITGVVAQMQGRSEEALAAWSVLRERLPADPAVQESLLAAPYLQRQLQSPQAAAGLYEQAVASLSGELGRLDSALKSVQQGETVSRLLDQGGRQSIAGPASRYLEELLVSRAFQRTSRGHSDMRSMLDSVDRGLESIGQLQQAIQPHRDAAAGQAKPRPGRASPGEPASQPGAVKKVVAAPKSAAGSDQDIAAWQGAQEGGGSDRGIPLLPEAKLPPEQALEQLPGSGAAGLPSAAEDIGLPAAPVDVGLPSGGDALGLPLAPEDIGLPPGSSWRELGQDEDDPRYTEFLARHEEQAAQSRRLLRRILRPTRSGASLSIDSALVDLAQALGHTTERMEQLARKLRASGLRDELLRKRIAALRARILALRKQIDAVLARYEDYARQLVLTALKARRAQLENHLRQARLELAKTYDAVSAE